MLRRVISETEIYADLFRLCVGRDAIGDRCAGDRDANNVCHRSSSLEFVLEVASRGYRSARARSAEIVVHRRAMSYAKCHDRKNSDRESLTERVSTILSMSPALRPMKESAWTMQSFSLRARCTCLECDACEATSGCS